MPTHIWSARELEILMDNKADKNLHELSALLNVSEKAVQLKLCRLKPEYRHKPKINKKVTSNTLEILKEKYFTHSLQDLSSLLGVSIYAVQTEAKKLKLTKSKYSNNLFFNGETKLNCYWAGFLAADGCVRRRKESNSYSIILGLEKKDVNQLLQFKRDIDAFDYDLCYSQHVQKNTNYISERYAVQVTISKQCVLDLSDKFSITPVKSLTLLPPKILTYQNKLAFIKGYIDGDGSILKDKSHKKGCASCIGTFELLNWIKETLNLDGVPKKHSCNDKNTYVIYIKNSSAKEIKNSIPYRGLERKWDKIT